MVRRWQDFNGRRNCQKSCWKIWENTSSGPYSTWYRARINFDPKISHSSPDRIKCEYLWFQDMFEFFMKTDNYVINVKCFIIREKKLENLCLNFWSLSDEDITALTNLNCNFRVVTVAGSKHMKESINLLKLFIESFILF